MMFRNTEPRQQTSVSIIKCGEVTKDVVGLLARSLALIDESRAIRPPLDGVHKRVVH